MTFLIVADQPLGGATSLGFLERCLCRAQQDIKQAGSSAMIPSESTRRREMSQRLAPPPRSCEQDPPAQQSPKNRPGRDAGVPTRIGTNENAPSGTGDPSTFWGVIKTALRSASQTTITTTMAVAQGCPGWKFDTVTENSYGLISYTLLNGFSSGRRRTKVKPASSDILRTFNSWNPTVPNPTPP